MTSLMLPMLALMTSAGQEQAAQGAAAPAQADRKICRMIVPTGSITAKRFCLTKAQWNEMNDLTEASAKAMLDHRGTGMSDVGSR